MFFGRKNLAGGSQIEQGGTKIEQGEMCRTKNQQGAWSLLYVGQGFFLRENLRVRAVRPNFAHLEQISRKFSRSENFKLELVKCHFMYFRTVEN